MTKQESMLYSGLHLIKMADDGIRTDMLKVDDFTNLLNELKKVVQDDYKS